MIREKKCLSSCPLIQAQNLQCFIGHFFGQIFSSCHLLKQNLRCKRELTTLTREQFWSLYAVLAEQLRKCSLWPNIINLTPCPVRVGSYFGSRWPIRPPARVWPPNDHRTMTMTLKLFSWSYVNFQLCLQDLSHRPPTQHQCLHEIFVYSITLFLLASHHICSLPSQVNTFWEFSLYGSLQKKTRLQSYKCWRVKRQRATPPPALVGSVVLPLNQITIPNWVRWIWPEPDRTQEKSQYELNNFKAKIPMNQFP